MQLATRLGHLSLQHITYSSLAKDILGLSAFLSPKGAHRFSSDAARLCNSRMLTCCLMAHELRTPCTSQKYHQRQLRRLPSTSKFYSSRTLRLQISIPVDHWKSTKMEGPPDLMKWKPTVPLHANTRPVFLLHRNRTSGALLGLMSNWSGDYVKKQRLLHV
jgi:hypothetical protein